MGVLSTIIGVGDASSGLAKYAELSKSRATVLRGLILSSFSLDHLTISSASRDSSTDSVERPAIVGDQWCKSAGRHNMWREYESTRGRSSIKIIKSSGPRMLF